MARECCWRDRFLRISERRNLSARSEWWIVLECTGGSVRLNLDKLLRSCVKGDGCLVGLLWRKVGWLKWIVGQRRGWQWLWRCKLLLVVIVWESCVGSACNVDRWYSSGVIGMESVDGV